MVKQIVENKNECGFVVSFPGLPRYIICDETVETVVVNALDAENAWLGVALEDGIPIHEANDLEDYSGQFKRKPDYGWRSSSNYLIY